MSITYQEQGVSPAVRQLKEEFHPLITLHAPFASNIISFYPKPINLVSTVHETLSVTVELTPEAKLAVEAVSIEFNGMIVMGKLRQEAGKLCLPRDSSRYSSGEET